MYSTILIKLNTEVQTEFQNVVGRCCTLLSSGLGRVSETWAQVVLKCCTCFSPSLSKVPSTCVHMQCNFIVYMQCFFGVSPMGSSMQSPACSPSIRIAQQRERERERERERGIVHMQCYSDKVQHGSPATVSTCCVQVLYIAQLKSRSKFLHRVQLKSK